MLEEGKQNHIQELYCIEMDNALIDKQTEVLMGGKTKFDKKTLLKLKAKLLQSDIEIKVEKEAEEMLPTTSDEAVGTLIDPPPVITQALVSSLIIPKSF